MSILLQVHVFRFFIAAFLLTVAGLPCSVQAGMVARLGGLAVYDNVSGLTWLANANVFDGQGSGSFTDGRFNYADALIKVASLNVAGVTGWRLPIAVEVDSNCSNQEIGAGISTGYNCINSEMGDLFYRALGGEAHKQISEQHNANYNLFTNVLNGYWYSTPYKNDPTAYAWLFGFGDGSQNIHPKSFVLNIWPVIDGDVGGGGIPEPDILGLFGIGSVMAWAFTKRKRLG
jgi:hypothetical protein